MQKAAAPRRTARACTEERQIIARGKLALVTVVQSAQPAHMLAPGAGKAAA